jgi:thiol-disulfide isomerase/thioredoxin
MKKIVLVLLITFHSLLSVGQTSGGIVFDSLTFTEAISKSALVKKPVFIFGYASWCHFCEEMRDSVLTDPAIGKFYNEHFVCIKLDLEKAKNELLEISKLSTKLEKLLSVVKNSVAELPSKMDTSNIRSEYEMYLQLYAKTNSSKSMIVKNVDSAKDLAVLQNQEQNVLIVLKSFQSLEQNLIN